ncbi:19917_t:CDS:10 [Funneliformis geosporum]|uniref:2051_t:CDS:1 n=1 Tax=Funneliformis geosporum TaxID=1117311 RepID=A0A9W4SA44_9GLOM|nr:2051_t:CDS:10 [Funneliformis geosporum]CAI2173900.1 19917_t:CDS:10 [Funneliformis geosporum]
MGKKSIESFGKKNNNTDPNSESKNNKKLKGVKRKSYNKLNSFTEDKILKSNKEKILKKPSEEQIQIPYKKLKTEIKNSKVTEDIDNVSKNRKQCVNNKVLKEITALGGSKSDLKLIESVDSDIESNDGKKSINDERLKADLKKLMNGDENEVIEDSEYDEDEGMEILEKQEVEFNKPNRFWYNIKVQPLSDSKERKITDKIISDMYDNALNLLNEENNAYEAIRSRRNASDRSFYATMLKSGTLKDRLATLSVLVEESPMHAIRALDTLFKMAKKENRNEAVQAVESLKNLMIELLLPPNRKLKFFRDQLIYKENISNKNLILWSFEDYLKRKYFELIRIIEILSYDVVIYVKLQILGIIFTLFMEKPEQESNLLKLLVNKLGDNEKKAASKASYLIDQIFPKHPSMKKIVIQEIEQLILSPAANNHAQYYGVIALSRIILARRDKEVANKLIDIYFVLFAKLLETKDKEIKHDKVSRSKTKKRDIHVIEFEDAVDSKMIAALLTGVNRAYKFAQVDNTVFEKHLDVLYRITYVGTFNISIQALMLIFQVSSDRESLSERFYRALYHSLLDPRLVKTSKHALYLNLLYKALKSDPTIVRVEAFLKRLVQICGHHEPHFICGALYLLAELIVARPILRPFIVQSANYDEEGNNDKPSEKNDESSTKNDLSIESWKDDTQYDARKRDPQYSNADKTRLWELIINGQPISGHSELHLHTITHFLDKFVFRNPKKHDKVKGSNPLLQPTVTSEPGRVVIKKGTGISKDELNVNSKKFWTMELKDVPVDQKHAGKDLQKVKKNKQISEENFELDEGGEDYESDINSVDTSIDK